MINILVATHGDFCNGLINSLEMITGKHEGLKTLSLREGDDPAKLCKDMQNYANNSKDGVIILVDLLGGCPCNNAAQLLKNKNVEVVSGVNLPMLIQVVESRSQMNLKELAETAVKVVNETTCNVRERLFNN